MPSHEQRESDRFDLKVNVTLESDHNFYLGFAENLSEGGLFIATDARCRVGEPVRVRLSLPGREEPLLLEGRVRWIRETPQGGDSPGGFGLAFGDLADDVRAAVETFIRRREPLFYDD